MKKNLLSALSVLLTIFLLCASILPVFASDDANVFESVGVYLDGDENPHSFRTRLTFDPSSGRLTIDEDAGNILSIDHTDDLLHWIRPIADRVKTVYLTKTSILSHFTNDEHVLAAYPFHRAFAYLTNLERFEVEKGNETYKAVDGVLYTAEGLSLVHYPSAKPDKTYKIDEHCIEGLEPYAFCNTKYLERLEFPYSRMAMTYFNIETYSLSAVDLDTGEAKESSIKTIVFYGSEKTFFYYNDFYEGNNVAHQAQVIFREPDAKQNVSSFFTAIGSYFRMFFKMIREFFSSLSFR